jgi:3-isopropylmalate dehydrogenase
LLGELPVNRPKITKPNRKPLPAREQRLARRVRPSSAGSSDEIETSSVNSTRLLLLDGDGVGPEVMGLVRRVIGWINRNTDFKIEIIDGLIGGASIDAHGTPITKDILTTAIEVDAVLLGAVGGPKWDGQSFETRPEAGLLQLRKELGLFANLRPATVLDPLIEASPLKPEIVRELNIMIVRELTGGIYFGEPRGIEEQPDGTRRGVNTHQYTTSEIHRVARVAFDLAAARGNKLTSVEKANVMEAGLLWREEVSVIGDNEYPGVELSHMYADNCAMQLVRAPSQFDVILTDNLFGDMLSDQASMLTGSLGMLPSAALGDPDEDGRRPAMYEPVHGSAPDIAGKDLANPCAMLLSFAMCLRLSNGREDLAGRLEQAVMNVLKSGLRTNDIMTPGLARVSGSVLGDSILREMDKIRN